MKDIQGDEKCMSLVCKFPEPDVEKFCQLITKAGFDVKRYDPLIALQVGPIPPSTTQAQLEARIKDLGLTQIEKGEVRIDRSGVARCLRIFVRRSNIASLVGGWNCWMPEEISRFPYRFRERVPPSTKICVNCWTPGHVHTRSSPCKEQTTCAKCHQKGHHASKCEKACAGCLVCKGDHIASACDKVKFRLVLLDKDGKRSFSESSVRSSRPAARPVSSAVSFASVAGQPSTQGLDVMKADVLSSLKSQIADEIKSQVQAQVAQVQAAVNASIATTRAEVKQLSDRVDSLPLSFDAKLSAMEATIMKSLEIIQQRLSVPVPMPPLPSPMLHPIPMHFGPFFPPPPPSMAATKPASPASPAAPSAAPPAATPSPSAPSPAASPSPAAHARPATPSSQLTLPSPAAAVPVPHTSATQPAKRLKDTEGNPIPTEKPAVTPPVPPFQLLQRPGVKRGHPSPAKEEVKKSGASVPASATVLFPQTQQNTDVVLNVQPTASSANAPTDQPAQTA